MTNEQLAARIQSGEDVAENMLELWKQNKGFIAKMSIYYSGRAELDDLQQEGFIGLCDAVQHYKADSGVPFINYAAFWIKQRMKRYIENCGGIVRIPSHAQEQLYRYRRFLGEYRKYYGSEPSDEETSYYLDVDNKKLEDIRKSSCMSKITSLSAPIAGTDEDITLEDMAASPEDVEGDVIGRIDYQNMKRRLWEAVDALPAQQSGTLRARYIDGKTLKEVGAMQGVSLQQARQLESKAMRSLRIPSKCRHFKGYWEEYLQAASVRHVGVREFKYTWTSEVEKEAMRG